MFDHYDLSDAICDNNFEMFHKNTIEKLKLYFKIHIFLPKSLLPCEKTLPNLSTEYGIVWILQILSDN